MNIQKYQIVFNGRILRGVNPEKVKSNLAALFKLDRDRIEQLFAGKRFVIKKGLDLADGQVFQAALEKAGAICEIVPEPAEGASAENREFGRNSTREIDRMPSQKPDPGKPDASREIVRDVDAPGLRQQVSSIKDRVKSVTADDIQEKLGSFQEKAKQLEIGEVPRKIGSKIEGIRSSIEEDYLAGGIGSLLKNRFLRIAAGVAAIGLVMVAIIVFSGSKPMPADQKTLETFMEGFNRRLLEVELGRHRAITSVKIAKTTIEDMGYHYDETLLYWRFNRHVSETALGASIYRDQLIGPLEVLSRIDPQQVGKMLAPETYKTMKDTFEIKDNIDLQSIRMLKACKRTGALLKHEDIIKVLEAQGVEIDPGHPDLAIQETFYGLNQNHMIEMHQRIEWKKRFSKKLIDIEILDMDQIDAQEEKLVYLNEMYKKYVDVSGSR